MLKLWLRRLRRRLIRSRVSEALTGAACRLSKGGETIERTIASQTLAWADGQRMNAQTNQTVVKPHISTSIITLKSPKSKAMRAKGPPEGYFEARSGRAVWRAYEDGV